MPRPKPVRKVGLRVRTVFTLAMGGSDWRLRANALFMMMGICGSFIALATIFPEGWWQDRRFASVGGGSFSEEVVLIALDDHFAERYDRPDPTPRDYLARILGAAAGLNPSVIAFDFRLGPSAEADTSFAQFRQAAREAAQRGIVVVLPSAASWPDPEIVLTPPASLNGIVASGLVSAQSDRFGASGAPELRTLTPLQKMVDGRLATSFALAAVAAHRCGEAPRTVPSPRGVMPAVAEDEAGRLLDCAGLRHAAASPARRGTRPVLLDYAGPPRRTGGLAVYSSETFLEGVEGGHFDPSWIEGRLVVVASTFEANYDLVETPFGTARGGWYHLYAIDTLLRDAVRGDRMRPVALGLALLFFTTIILAWLGPGWRALLVSASLLGGYVIVAFLWYGASGAMLPVAFPLYAGLFAATLGFLFHDVVQRARASDGVAEPVAATTPTGR
jgi:CHASE2 domain-containing sensor protein